MKKIYLNAQTQVVELEMDNAIMLNSRQGITDPLEDGEDDERTW